MTKYFKRFNDIDRAYLYTDKHIHTKICDGEGSISEIVETATKCGLTHIAVTEHVRLSSDYVMDYFKEIDKARARSSIKVFSGVEARISGFDGEIDAAKDVLSNAHIKIASVHRFTVGEKLYPLSDFKKNICQEIELNLSVAAIRKGLCNVLGHPGAMSLKAYGEFPLSFFEQIIKECRKHDIAFEINSTYHALVLEKIKGLLKKYDPFVSLGSDAHTLEQIGNCANILKVNNGKI